MARKLDELEQRIFAEALLLTDAGLRSKDGESFVDVLLQKRDAPLRKSRELARWLEPLWAEETNF